MVVVFNSSPWIFLSKLGLIEKAIELFSKIYIPDGVNNEIIERRDEAFMTMEKLQKLKQIEIVKAANFRLVKALSQRLGKGEAEAIAIALEKEIDAVILDDHIARLEAKRLGLQAKGTLGIIKKLIVLGKYSSDLEELYEQLMSKGFRIKEGLFWEIFRE